MTFVQILILAVIQGAAELLPVSSSAHVIVAEKLMRLDPTRPEMTLLLVMLHTGTMFAVIFFFWQSWKTNVPSFIAGMLALRWLSNWLERGRWHLFGIYCLCASVIVFLLHRSGL
jgi:undecaprenyl pyrophosphate phosphatase UppP